MVIGNKQQIRIEMRWKRTANGKSRVVGEAGASWIDSKSREEGLEEGRGSGRMWKAPFTWTKENFHVRPERPIPYFIWSGRMRKIFTSDRSYQNFECLHQFETPST
jgi:hypothetical protein